KMEQAERLQAKHDRAVQANRPLTNADTEALQATWKEDRRWWQTYLEENAGSPSAPTARLHLARCLQALGERDAAITQLENLTEDIPPLQKTARLYLAKQLKASVQCRMTKVND